MLRLGACGHCLPGRPLVCAAWSDFRLLSAACFPGDALYGAKSSEGGEGPRRCCDDEEK